MMRLASVLLLQVVLVLLGRFNHYTIAAADSGVLCKEEEKEALLDFKLSFTADPNGTLSDWTTHNPECCLWGGVTCDGNTGNVVKLEFYWGSLESHQLRPSLLVLQHLTYLDLSYNNFTMKIPEFIGSFPKLTHLKLSNSGFYGKVPPHLGNLTSLEILQMDQLPGLLYADDLKWLSHLSSMQVLDLNGANLSNATDWLTTLKKLPSLSDFDCSSCSLPDVPPLGSSLCSHNHSTSLQNLDLSYSHISSSSILCLINGTNNLYRLTLASMNPGQNPDGFLFQSAVRLMLFPMLQNLDISGNQLSELMLPQMPNLKNLGISHNLLNTVPYLSPFSSLESLDASFNRLNGTLYANLQQLPKNLTHLDLSANSLNDVISDAHFSNFSSLTDLILSENYLLTFNFSKSWMPPLQLKFLNLRSCKLGPRFPNWLLLTPKTLQMLDISNSSIAGVVPSAFWNHITGLSYLYGSNNKLEGALPNLSLVYNNLQHVDLSFNEFHGPIPLFMFMARYLDLSNNKFSSLPTTQHGVSNLSSSQINLSNNLLSGSLPDWIFQIKYLVGLNLAYNMLSGAIPITIASSSDLNALHLNSNRLSGELPSSMKNCSQLVILQLGNNNFAGSVPFWLGDNLQWLVVLSLRSNNLSGDLPSNLCQLQRLQILDLSGNKISGSIPGCVQNFTSMATDTLPASDQPYIFMHSTVEYLDYTTIAWKGILANESCKNLPQWNVIDLSDNRLMGEIPSGVTSLKYLRSLDLSMNNINGSIPDKIDQLIFLEVLKLSSNKLQGEIPQSLAGLTFLNTLNLSSNSLTGRIPKSTQLQSFDPSSYGGNPGLCGEPLPTKCPGDKGLVTPPTIAIDQTGKKDHETFDMEAFYAALGTGFAFGLFGILGILHFHAPSRHAFFHMASEVGDWIFVRTFLCQSKIKRSLGF